MAAAIKKAYSLEPKLIASGGGIFDVAADGRLVFSKHEQGRFPEDQEVLDLLAPLTA